MKICKYCGTFHADKKEVCSVCHREDLRPYEVKDSHGAFFRLFFGLFRLIFAAVFAFGTALALAYFDVVPVYTADLIPLSLAYLGLFELRKYRRRRRRERRALAEPKTSELDGESPIVTALKESAAALSSPFQSLANSEGYEAPRPVYDDSYSPLRAGATADAPILSIASNESLVTAGESSSPFSSPIASSLSISFGAPATAPTASPLTSSLDTPSVDSTPAPTVNTSVSFDAFASTGGPVSVPTVPCDDTLTIPDAFEILYSRLTGISRRTVRTLLASAATARLLLLSDNPKVDGITFNEAGRALAGYDAVPLAPAPAENGFVSGDLAILVSEGEGARHGVTLGALPAESTALLGNCLAPIADRLARKNPDDNASFLLVSRFDAEATAAALPDPATLAGAAVVTVLPKKRSSKVIEFADYSGRHLALAHLVALAEAAEEDYFISEELWKKLDTIEEHLAAISDFAITNSVARMIERYTAVFMAAGGTETEAFDSVLASRLLPPVLAALIADADIHRNETFTHYLDSVLGIDNLPMTAELLRKFGIS